MTTAIFLYIAILLPAIAFGSLNDESTRGEIGKSEQTLNIQIRRLKHLGRASVWGDLMCAGRGHVI